MERFCEAELIGVADFMRLDGKLRNRFAAKPSICRGDSFAEQLLRAFRRHGRGNSPDLPGNCHLGYSPASSVCTGPHRHTLRIVTGPIGVRGQTVESVPANSSCYGRPQDARMIGRGEIRARLVELPIRDPCESLRQRRQFAAGTLSGSRKPLDDLFSRPADPKKALMARKAFLG